MAFALARRVRWPRVWAATQRIEMVSAWSTEPRSTSYGAGRAVETLVGLSRRCGYPGTRVALWSKCGHASAVYYAQRTNLVDRYVRRGSTADRGSLSAVPRASREVRGRGTVWMTPRVLSQTASTVASALAMRARWPRVWAATQSRDVTSMWAVEARSRPYGAGRAVEAASDRTLPVAAIGALRSPCGGRTDMPSLHPTPNASV